MANSKTFFGIGFTIQPHVGWYIETPVSSSDVYIPGTAYLLGKLFQMQLPKVFYRKGVL